jgi:general secretion pathway protein N
VSGVNGETVTTLAAGDCKITAAQAGDDDYNDTDASYTVTIGKSDQTIEDFAADPADPTLGKIDNKPVVLPPASAFAAIEAHPIFNEDRKPTPQDTSGTDEADAPPPNPLSVMLTGVILDDKNHVRIAMLQDKARNQPVALRVGMPLEGDQASWTLVEVKPRAAVFRSAANETTEVELETAVAALKPAAPAPKGPAPRPGGSPPRPGQPPAAAGTNANADLARRIEDRRKQMRDEAERLRNGKPPAGQPKK